MSPLIFPPPWGRARERVTLAKAAQAWSGARKRDTFSGQVPPIGSTVNVAAATYTNTSGAIELNGSPHRLDLGENETVEGRVTVRIVFEGRRRLSSDSRTTPSR